MFECDTTYRVHLRDNKLTSFIALDLEPFGLGQQLQGEIFRYFFSLEILALQRSSKRP